jgi:hypothetical protein
VNESFVLNDIAVVSNLYFNLFSVLQILDGSFEVRFKKGLSRVWIARKILFVGFHYLDDFF